MNYKLKKVYNTKDEYIIDLIKKVDAQKKEIQGLFKTNQELEQLLNHCDNSPNELKKRVGGLK